MSRPSITPNRLLPETSASLHDQVQIALAIADEAMLKTLLLDSTPPLAQPHWLGAVTVQVGVPLAQGRSVDGVLQFEVVHCVLADASSDLERHLARGDRDRRENQYAQLTRCESETRTLGQGLSLAQVLAMLHQSGFPPDQIQAILHLPQEACHKSWWYMLDAEGNFSQPFRRTLRTLRYADGTFALYYKDQFSQDKPPCFKSLTQKALVEIKSPHHGFSKTLEKINRHRELLSIQSVILICDDLTDLEAQGFIQQGISVYMAQGLVLPMYTNCSHCGNDHCPLQGALQSPVRVCQRFCFAGQLQSES